MRTDSRVLGLGLLALLSACGHPVDGGPPDAGGTGFEAPRFEVLQATPAYRFAEAEDAIVAALNVYRAKHGLKPLTEMAVLRTFSRAHATDMVNRNYFSHTNPEGKGPYQRLQAAGVGFAYYAATNSYASTRASAVIHDWDTHPGKAFVLDSRLTHVGVGVAGPAANGRYRVTATYIRPKAPTP